MFKEKIKITSIDIGQILGHVLIKAHDSDEVIVETTEEDKVKIKQYGSTLSISTKIEKNKDLKSSSKKGIFNSFRGMNITGNVTIQNNNVIIQNGNVISGGDLATVDMTIYVPREMVCDIDLSGQIKVTVEDISKQLTIDNSGQTTITILNVEKIDLDTSGQSKAYINGVKVIIADISGQSKAEFTGDVINKVKLDVSGQSNMKINSSVIERIKGDISGMSKVKVYGEVRSKDVDTSGMSSIQYK